MKNRREFLGIGLSVVAPALGLTLLPPAQAQETGDPGPFVLRWYESPHSHWDLLAGYENRLDKLHNMAKGCLWRHWANNEVDSYSFRVGTSTSTFEAPSIEHAKKLAEQEFVARQRRIAIEAERVVFCA